MLELENTSTFQGPWDGAISFPIMAHMRESGQFCDVTIHSGNQSIQAHRFILAAAIPYFRDLFRSGTEESTTAEFTVENVDPLALKHVINFLYSNEIKITSKNVTCILETSMYLQFDFITDACFNFLLMRMNPSNVFMIRRYAELVKVDMLETIDRFVRGQFEEISTFEEFISLPYVALKNLISRNDLLVMGEESVFEAVMRWVKASEDSRRIYLPQLLREVRMIQLKPEFLNKRVSTEELVRMSPECKNLVNEAKHWNALPNEISVSCSFNTQQRYCRELHHLKCAKTKGHSMYMLCRSADSRIFINYYDSINSKWDTLLCDDISKALTLPFYVICTAEKIYVFNERCILALNLKTLYLTQTECNEVRFLSSAIVLHQNRVFFFGSCCDTLANKVYVFDPQLAKCVLEGQMVRHRPDAVAASLGRHIYVFGGWINESVLRSAERYDPENRESVEIAPMPTDGVVESCTAVSGKIYVCGEGTSNDGSSIGGTDVFVYDPLINQWNAVKETNRVMSFVRLVSYDRKLWAFSTYGSKNCLVETYNPSVDEWTSEESASDNLGRPCEILCSVATNSAAYFWEVEFDDSTLGGTDADAE